MHHRSLLKAGILGDFHRGLLQRRIRQHGHDTAHSRARILSAWKLNAGDVLQKGRLPSGLLPDHHDPRYRNLLLLAYLGACCLWGELRSKAPKLYICATAKQNPGQAASRTSSIMPSFLVSCSLACFMASSRFIEAARVRAAAACAGGFAPLTALPR